MNHALQPLLCLLCLTTQLVAQQQDEATVEPRQEVVETVVEDPRYVQLGQAREQLDQGRTAQAIEQLKALLEEDASFAEAHRLLGHALLTDGQEVAARDAFSQALAHGRLTADVLGNLMALDHAAGETTAALTAVRLLLFLDPDNLQLERQHVALLMQGDQTDAALRALTQLTHAAPDDTELMLQRANLHLQRGEDRQALVLLESAWLKGSTRAEIPLLLSTLYTRLEVPELALEWLTRVTPGEGIDEQELAWREAALHERLGDMAAAHRLARQSLPEASGQRRPQLLGLLLRTAPPTFDPDQLTDDQAEQLDSRYLVLIAQRLLADGRSGAAAPWFQRAHQRGDLTPRQCQHYLTLLIELGEHTTARQLLVDLIARQGFTPANRQLLAHLAESGGGN